MDTIRLIYIGLMSQIKNKGLRVVVLGASPKRVRFSNRVIRLLQQHGYHTIPVHPVHREIEGLTVRQRLNAIHDPVHTLTLYIGPAQSKTMIAEIIALNPGRVILNPGTESPVLAAALSEHGIPVVQACTLTLLRQDRF